MRLYVSLFEDSRVLEIEHHRAGEAQSGVKQARFLLAGREHIAMDSDGPHRFTFTPATSLVVECSDEHTLEEAFAELARDGSILMPLQEYPFSPRFGWLTDRYGVSWQLNLIPD